MRRSAELLLGAAIVGVGAVVVVGSAAVAFLDLPWLCEEPAIESEGSDVWLTGAGVGEVLPASVACAWRQEGAVFVEYRAVNQEGQLAGALVVGAGLMMLVRAGTGDRTNQHRGQGQDPGQEQDPG